MDNISYPCDKCARRYSCGDYVKCIPWRTWFLYRWGQINAYAEKVLPGFYERQQKEGTK